jgi:hypothetical protein
MIARIAHHRDDVAGLIRYLYGTGPAGDDADPRIVAGWRTPVELEPPRRRDGRRDLRRVTGLLEQTVAALRGSRPARPVWHCVMRAAPDDRQLADGEWAQIASDVMDRTGLSPAGQEDDAVRWVAIRRGADRIHVVATLARQDGGKPGLPWERLRVRGACLAAEERHGLRRTAPARSGTARGPSAAEARKARDHGLDQPPRLTLHRHVSTAAEAASEEEFFARLAQAGVRIRKRFSPGNPSDLTGYAVALPGDTGTDGGPVWYGGGKLGADLTLPRLRQCWTQPGIAARDYPVSAADATRAGSPAPGSQPQQTPGMQRAARPCPGNHAATVTNRRNAKP